MNAVAPAAAVTDGTGAGVAAAIAADGLQHWAAYGYTFNACRHGLLRVADGPRARRFLAALLQRHWLTVAEVGNRLEQGPSGAGWTLNLGLTFGGLQALRLHPALLGLLRRRAPAFAVGAAPRAALLGDCADSGAARWEPPFAHRRAHLLLTLHAGDAAVLAERWHALQQLEGADGLDGWSDGYTDGRHLNDDADARVVHFGFRDGIANPRLLGLHKPPAGGRPALHATGELLLGHAGNDGCNPWLIGNAPQASTFFRNASFGAYRKIAQDEVAFRRFVGDAARELGVELGWVMAKLCGRHADGRPLVSDASDPAPGATANGFDFATDPAAAGCPFGAHIRRLNPRNDGIVQRRSRPLMRRGMPYGPRYDGTAAADQPRGLLGMFFCASLEHQFEHLLGAWANRNPLGPDNPGTAKDPLIGQHDDPRAWFVIPGADGSPPRRLSMPRPFVATRGTAYLLFPTAPALQALADGVAGVVAGAMAERAEPA